MRNAFTTTATDRKKTIAILEQFLMWKGELGGKWDAGQRKIWGGLIQRLSCSFESMTLKDPRPLRTFSENLTCGPDFEFQRFPQLSYDSPTPNLSNSCSVSHQNFQVTSFQEQNSQKFQQFLSLFRIVPFRADYNYNKVMLFH